MKATIHIISLGCPKNLIDSEVMAGLLCEAGFHITEIPEQADIILINTCTFITPAKEESIDEIFRMAQMKQAERCRFLVVTGCLPQRYGKVLQQEIPEVDLFLGIDDIPHIAHRLRNLTERVNDTHHSNMGKPTFLMDSSYPRIISSSPHSTYLKIADGCSNHCSYCVIPLVRGELRSRKPEDILKEAERLATQGVKEIIITAQETTAYGRDLPHRPRLAPLLKDLCRIDGIRWIRLLYTHPAGIADDVLSAVAEEEKICNYIDLPIQHIDDDILKSMNRRVTGVAIKNVINKCRAVIPNLALRTSLIVGYPGETEEKFERLREFIHEARFDHLGVFIYSHEEDTVAASLPDHVPDDEKEVRRDIIMEEQAIISYDINQSLVDTIQEIMIEGPSDIPGYHRMGRLKRQAPDIDGMTYVAGTGGRVGSIISCRIESAEEYDLYAQTVRKPY
ncbi:MAG TPA: 30S ribosomal protein S12 methylthiotransferase RimO [Deltaproteobacteria bacterium]|nr:30S ribosomal protein S12 methylthiotransferase RimO [Deltaproteobacteria bacterium]